MIILLECENLLPCKICDSSLKISYDKTDKSYNIFCIGLHDNTHPLKFEIEYSLEEVIYSWNKNNKKEELYNNKNRTYMYEKLCAKNCILCGSEVILRSGRENFFYIFLCVNICCKNNKKYLWSNSVEEALSIFNIELSK